MKSARAEQLDRLPRNFPNAVEVCFLKFADFTGRAPRAEYWYFYLFNVLAQIFATILDTLLHDLHPLMLGTLKIGDIGTMGILCLLGLFLPNLAVQVRRLHDRDRSGWFALLLIIPLGPLVLLVINCLPGTQGPNRFGAPIGAPIGAPPRSDVW
jgi:uncharacterized membrane protein YhaH (DUF805 family)